MTSTIPQRTGIDDNPHTLDDISDIHNRASIDTSIRPVEERNSSRIRFSVFFILIIALVYVIVDSLNDRHIESAILDFLHWVELHPSRGILAVIGVYILATILFVPGSILTFGTAYAFGSAYHSKVHGVIVASMVSSWPFIWLGDQQFSHFFLVIGTFVSPPEHATEDRLHWCITWIIVDVSFRTLSISKLRGSISIILSRVSSC